MTKRGPAHVREVAANDVRYSPWKPGCPSVGRHRFLRECAARQVRTAPVRREGGHRTGKPGSSTMCGLRQRLPIHAA